MKTDCNGFEYNRVVIRRGNSHQHNLTAMFVNDETKLIKSHLYTDQYYTGTWISTFDQFNECKHNCATPETWHYKETLSPTGERSRHIVRERNGVTWGTKWRRHAFEGSTPREFIFDKIAFEPHPNDNTVLFNGPKFHNAVVMRVETKFFYHADDAEGIIEQIESNPLNRTRITQELTVGAEHTIARLRKLS